MKFKMKKLICCENKKKAVIGKRYYFYHSVVDLIKDMKNSHMGNLGISMDVLTNIFNDSIYCFEPSKLTCNFAFLYPVDDEDDKDKENSNDSKEDNSRYLTYEEMKQLWFKNPNMIICHNDESFTITGFYDDEEDSLFYGGNGCKYGFVFYENDIYNIGNITTLDGKKFTLNNFPQFKKGKGE